MPAGAFWPERPRRQIRRLTDRCPGICVFAIFQRVGVDLLSEIDELGSIWRQVAALFVNPAVKPLTRLKGISRRIPLDKLHPFTWSAAEYYCCVGIARQNE